MPPATTIGNAPALVAGFRRLARTVEGAPVGLEKLRVTVDRLPLQTPAAVKWLPEWLLVPMFVRRVPEMIIPYADAAALILKNLEPAGAMSRHRVGLALPIGMKGKKDRWAGRAA